VLRLFSLVLTKFVFSIDLARFVCEWLQGEAGDILESPVQKTQRVYGSNRSFTVIF
jgi:hypothetical protein